jgi:glucuronokinase
MIIRARAYPRAGLIGNPSDGYFGKTISFTFRNFAAEVLLYETPELEILPNQRDHSVFPGVNALVEDVRRHGYYGGIRLLKAAVKKFHDYCADRGVTLDERNFTIRYSSNIPHQVGLAGSSAIITACMRALQSFHGVTIPRPELANLVLSVETEELHISAGLQDRVAQAYQGLVYMDFDRELMASRGFGEYAVLPLKALPPLYIAYRAELAEGSEKVHGNLRVRFNRGETEVVDAMHYWAGLTEKARRLIEAGRGGEIGPLLDRNFDRRSRLYDVGEENRRMIEAARSVGASAKFTGSGGAIIGTYADARMYRRLKERLGKLRIRVLKPVYAAPVRPPEETA